MRFVIILCVLSLQILTDEANLAADFMNLACERNPDNPLLVNWSGADTVLGELADILEGKMAKPASFGNFELLVRILDNPLWLFSSNAMQQEHLMSSLTYFVKRVYYTLWHLCCRIIISA